MTVLKSLIALGLLILLSQGTQAGSKDCITNLMAGETRDTYAFYMHVDDVDREFGNDHLASAIYTLRILLDREGCSRGDVNFGKGPHGRSHSRCTKVIRNQEHTRVCYVETNLGYFFLTTDLLDNINILYSRWD
ncbi:MAG: hypothetical protein NXH75_07750 [Halobacteriovoraceae bacterium]|nr:hypothetical protein [Halobacteriovoraceae bacterium]